MNLNQSLLRAISLWPDNQAVADGQVQYTYRELGERVAALAAALRSARVMQSDVVGVIAPNCHEYLELYYAAAFSGVVLNPVNYRLNPEEIDEILSDCDVRVLFVHQDFQDTALKLLAKHSKIRLVIWLGLGTSPETEVKSQRYEPFLLSGQGAQLPSELPESYDLAQLYYTSGTTGRSKGVMISHENAYINALGAVTELNLSDADCWAHLAPMFHLVDAWAVWAITMVGGKHTFLPYFKAADVLPLLEKEKVTITALVPTMLGLLLSSPKSWEYSYPDLRMIMTAGSPIAPDLVRQVGDVFACDYVQFYGMTETSPFLTISLPYASHRHLPDRRLQEIKATTGRPFICAEVKVVKDDGKEVVRDGVEVGEIIARGPTVTKGYWNKPQQTGETIRRGWIHTGDLAVVNEDGYINIVDRKKDMIITGGENVYSTEVEHVLYEHPGVLECAVLGVPDESWGEIVKAVVVAQPGHEPSEAELIELVQSKLARYKAPKSIDFIDEMPKTGSGKIYKKKLRERYWQGRERKVH
ncbi:MAG: long-chain-fatty-acid--CoA ligase [Candidatus Obscuribacterales bacterium]|nr:long-chain-fatty-acid--CoA ligase [Candidatus Obscuribacterales bacterium]